MRFKDKIAIVTGGSRGIGQSIVTALATEGALVHFFYRSNDDAAQAVAEAMRDSAGEAIPHKLDVTHHPAVRAEVDSIHRMHSWIDLLVNNAGITRDNLVLTMAENDFRAVIETNVVSVFVLSQHVAKYMMRRRSGVIVNMSSIAARRPQVGHCNYACSKAAVEAFTVSFAKELASKGVRVNAIAPGVIETDMMRPLLDVRGNEFLTRIPQGRFGTPAEVSQLCLFLLSEEARYITGHTFGVDGGLGA